MIFYTDAESRTLRTAVFGVMVLVSHADPGPVIQERYAGLRALTALSPDLRHALHASRVDLSAIPEAELEDRVLEALRMSVKILAAKAPDEAASFPGAVEEICHQVAAADGQVAEVEQAVIEKVRAALGG
jgi:tellurite resistance protein